MARFAAFVGRRVSLHYRSGEIFVPTSGVLVGDSGRSIFVEQHFEQKGRAKYLRWEIPYPCVLRIDPLEESVAAPLDPAPARPATPQAAHAAAASAGGVLLPAVRRPETA